MDDVEHVPESRKGWEELKTGALKTGELKTGRLKIVGLARRKHACNGNTIQTADNCQQLSVSSSGFMKATLLFSGKIVGCLLE